MGLVPGMPHIAFGGLAALAAYGAHKIHQKRTQAADQQQAEVQQREVIAQQKVPELPELGWDDVQPVDAIGLEVGYRLIPLVDKAQGGELLGRIKGIRKRLSQDVGFLVPSVHIRDNLDLRPDGYRIAIMGVTAGEGEIHPERELAINPGQVFGNLDGVPTRDPAFGLDAVWIDPSQRDHAQTLGYTVVDASTVVATHLNQLLLKQLHELLGFDEVQNLLQALAKQSPKLAEELVPATLSLNMLVTVLRCLLQEKVPIRDTRTIASAIAAIGPKSQDPAVYTAAARLALSRIIVQKIFGNTTTLPVMTLSPAMEQLLLKSLQQAQQLGNSDDIVLEPGLAERLQVAIREAAQKQEMAGKPAVLLVSAPLRAVLAKFARYINGEIHVLAFTEIPDDKQVTIEASIG
jgi:flagellar biosynthesis protein FlhA